MRVIEEDRSGGIAISARFHVLDIGDEPHEPILGTQLPVVIEAEVQSLLVTQAERVEPVLINGALHVLLVAVPKCNADDTDAAGEIKVISAQSEKTPERPHPNLLARPGGNGQ